MAEDVEFLTDYLVTEYGVHKEEDTPFSYFIFYYFAFTEIRVSWTKKSTSLYTAS